MSVTRERVDAVFENGLLRPVKPLNLREHERVSITVESGSSDQWLDQDALAWARQEGDPSIPLDEVRQRLSALDGPLSDLVIAERGEY